MIAGATADATIRLQTLRGTWETCGSDTAIGIDPESLEASADAWGPTKASFDLHRSVIALWPDLAAYAPVEIEIDGEVVWEGRTNDTPMREAEQVINVQCEGWQYHLDDDVYKRPYVHSKLTDWKDLRSFPNTNLAVFRSAAQVSSQQGVITLGWPNETKSPAGDAVGAMLDLGPSGAATHLVIELDRATVTNGTIRLYARGSNSPGLEPNSDAIANLQVNEANGLYVGSFAFPCRYIALFLFNAGGETSWASDQTARIKKAYVFADAAYESGYVSVLHASTIVQDALERATLLLSDDLSQIVATTFSIRDFVLSKASSPRKAIEAANAYHNWVTKMERGIRFAFRPRPTTPLLEMGVWPGSDFDDASANSGSEIFNRAIVEGNGGDGSPVFVERLAGTATLVDRRNFRRTEVIEMSSAITVAEANQLGDIFLEGHTTTPFKGTATVVAAGVRTILGGAPIHPSALLMRTQELIRLSHLIDPDTGGLGRDGTIAEVTYSHKDQKATIALDDKRGNFAALLSRLDAVQSVGS